MPQFSYTARDKSGALASSRIDAPSRRDALRILGTRGLQVISLNETTETGKGAPREKAARPEPAGKTDSFTSMISPRRSATEPRKRDRLPFLEALHDLTASGLSAGEAVRLLSVRLKEPAMKSLCQGLWEHISEGAPLSRAMAAFPGVFDTSTVNLIAAGEATGSLSETLSRLIVHLTEQRELRRDLISALAYPLFMLFVASGVILFFLFYLLPRMQTLLTSLGGKLPISTKILVTGSQFILHYGIFLVAGAIFLGISLWRWRATAAGRATCDAWILKLPVAGSFAVSQTVLSISQTLSVMLENGITTADALKMTERQINNTVHRDAFAEASARVLEGDSLSIALGRTHCFPDLILDRLAVGENTGNVVPSLKDIAKKYQKLISRQLHNFTGILSSVVLLAVFSFVGFLAFAIVSAVFQMSASFKM
ncbi:MAG: type II secretion system F family protein [Opitutaceae bacterium]|jgi:type II secretory pathway component PulF